MYVYIIQLIINLIISLHALFEQYYIFRKINDFLERSLLLSLFHLHLRANLLQYISCYITMSTSSTIILESKISIKSKMTQIISLDRTITLDFSSIYYIKSFPLKIYIYIEIFLKFVETLKF